MIKTSTRGSMSVKGRPSWLDTSAASGLDAAMTLPWIKFNCSSSTQNKVYLYRCMLLFNHPMRIIAGDKRKFNSEVCHTAKISTNKFQKGNIFFPQTNKHDADV